jgi:hypothetical protein
MEEWGAAPGPTYGPASSWSAHQEYFPGTYTTDGRFGLAEERDLVTFSTGITRASTPVIDPIVRKFFAEAVMVDASLNDDPMMGILQVHEHADELGDGIGVEAGLDNGGGMPRP